MSWIRRGVGSVVTVDDDSPSVPALRDQVAKLEHRIWMLTGVLRLVLALLRVSGFKLELSRIVSAGAKRRLLGPVERARKVMPLEAALRVLGCLPLDTTNGLDANAIARWTIIPVVRGQGRNA